MPNPAPIARNISTKVEQEAFELMYRQLSFVLVGTVVASTLVYLGISGTVTTLLLKLWLLLVWLSSFTRYLINRFYFERLRTSGLKTFYISGSLVSGALWGALPLIASIYNDLLAMAVTSIVVACMTSAAIAGLSPFPRAYYAFAFPAIIGMAASFPLYQFSGVNMLLVLSLCYLFVVVSFCHNINKTTINAIRLRLENEELLGEIRKQVSIAEKANIDKSRFLAAASHDLRQPFHALSLFVSAIKDEALNIETRGIIDNIRSSTHTLERMFTELLDVSRLDAGAVSAQPVHFSTQELIRELQEEYATIASEKSLEFSCPDNDAIIFSDPLLCERILRNILSNAFNYTEKGAVKLLIENDGSHVRIAVSDTGLGIKKDKHERIFSEFEQLHNPERDRNKGLGLGLAIVRRLCNLLELDIVLDSTPGRGSTFTLTLPAGNSLLVESESPDLLATEAENSLAGKRILVIDDDNMVLQGMKAQLEKWQCNVSLASNDTEAKARIQQVIPDLLICDYRLRETLTGLDVINIINSLIPAPVPSIIITGDTNPDIIRSILAESDSLVLHKPVQHARLRMAINSLLQT